MERKEFDTWSEDDKFSAMTHYFQLVEKIHENSNLIPQKILDEISDDVYAHFEP